MFLIASLHIVEAILTFTPFDCPCSISRRALVPLDEASALSVPRIAQSIAFPLWIRPSKIGFDRHTRHLFVVSPSVILGTTSTNVDSSPADFNIAGEKSAKQVSIYNDGVDVFAT